MSGDISDSFDIEYWDELSLASRCMMSATTEEENAGRKETTRFEDEAGQPQPGLAAELLSFLLHNKKWWLAPIIVVLLLVGILVVLAGSGAAPFIYTLF